MTLIHKHVSDSELQYVGLEPSCFEAIKEEIKVIRRAYYGDSQVLLIPESCVLFNYPVLLPNHKMYTVTLYKETGEPEVQHAFSLSNCFGLIHHAHKKEKPEIVTEYWDKLAFIMTASTRVVTTPYKYRSYPVQPVQPEIEYSVVAAQGANALNKQPTNEFVNPSTVNMNSSFSPANLFYNCQPPFTKPLPQPSHVSTSSYGTNPPSGSRSDFITQDVITDTRPKKRLKTHHQEGRQQAYQKLSQYVKNTHEALLNLQPEPMQVSNQSHIDKPQVYKYHPEMNMTSDATTNYTFKMIDGLIYRKNAVNVCLASRLTRSVISVLDAYHNPHIWQYLDLENQERITKSVDIKYKDSIGAKRNTKQRHATIQFHAKGKFKYEFSGKMKQTNVLPFQQEHWEVLKEFRNIGILTPGEPDPDCLLVNVYLPADSNQNGQPPLTPGDCIPFHRDSDNFGDHIYALSLGTVQEIIFCSPKAVVPRGTNQFDANRVPVNGTKHEIHSLQLYPRSCLKMSGFSRYVFEHGVPPVTDWRISFTFRRYLPLHDK
eukprot:CAMPEP_0197844152 /NCGR_PEP_ID=MMETSP1438-20131217/1134_1 /TAXON_ID=1461541 /ORGANISM="Pterosperma sp., Strain CCMP1384" /LENGTH=542 /DNA_ID=CAMNT_0043454779 /DNA_START=1035 /DNA_END=2663 /DNA_ORIENTATION=-